MSKKSVASIKTLARYEPDTVYIGTGEYVAECVRADDGDYYLAEDVGAAIEALQAENERLLAEVERLRADRDSWEQQASDRVADWHAEHQRAERLAEALRDARRALAFAAQHLPECNEPYERANAALQDQEDRNG